MGLYLLDTDAIIDYLNGVRASVAFVQELYENGNRLCTCDIVIAETNAGLTPKLEGQAEELLMTLAYLEMSRDAARQAGIWRFTHAQQGQQLAITDCLIAAMAWQHQANVVTANIKDYPMSEIEVIALPKAGS
jgi:predicted nucleic acid-binding protein